MKHDTSAIKATLLVSDFCRKAGVELKKQGAVLRGACPLEDCRVSKRSPFALNASETGWRCNACEEKGDVIRLIKVLWGLDDREAIAEAAKISGIERLPTSERRELARKSKERQAEADARAKADRAAATLRAPEYWASCARLDKNKHGEALAYLDSRGLLAARGELRTDGDWLCLPLHNADGEIINVVKRRYRGEGPKLRTMASAGTLGTFGKLTDEALTSGPVVLVEGVTDYLSARVLLPSGLVLGAQGAGRLPSVVEIAAPVAVKRGLTIVPHMSDSNKIGARKASEAIVAARSAGVTELRRVELVKGDLNDYLVASGDESALLDAPRLADSGARVYLPTDLGNGRRFAHMQRERLRFLADAEVWRRYDGRAWALASEKTTVLRAAMDVCDRMLVDAQAANDGEARKWAMKSQGRDRMSAMVATARACDELQAEQADFDQSPNLFNVGNGTIDLASGSLQPHNLEDMLTQCSEVAYDGDAKAPRWHAFLDEVFATNPEDIGFLQRFAGYSLTADTGAQVALFLHGSGANGKGVICRVLRAVMGQLCGVLPMELFRDSAFKQIKPEYYVGGIAGRRAMFISEGKRGDVLDTSLFKDVTGDDLLSGRFAHGRPFDFVSRAKLWFAMNDLPHVRADDHATWRRILLLPFHESFRDRRDPTLEPALMKELAGILAWIVRGARDYLDFGGGLAALGETRSMAKAKAAYRQYTDDFGQFLAMFELRNQAAPAVREHIKLKTDVFLSKYMLWCRKQLVEPMSPKAVGREMKRRNLAREGRYYPVRVANEPSEA